MAERTAVGLAAGSPEREILDFSANINPLGPPEWLLPLISSQVSMLQHYPDPHCTALVEAAQRYGVGREEVIAGNGSTEILYLLTRAAQKSRRADTGSFLRRLCQSCHASRDAN